jgi:tetratricopeptide (TPR) repeat protein
MHNKKHIPRLTWVMPLVCVIMLLIGACKTKVEQAKEHFDKGVQLETQNMMEEALQEFKQAIQLDPNYADAHFHLGSVYHYLEAYTLAIDEYEKVIQINPNYPKGHTALANVYYVQGIRGWGKAVKLDQSKYWQADTLRQLPFKDRADLVKLMEDYLNKLKTDADNAEIISKLSQAYYLLAVEEYQKAIQVNSSDTAALLYLGLTYSELGYPQKVMAQYESLKKVDSRSAELLDDMLKQKEKEEQYLEELKKKGK